MEVKQEKVIFNITLTDESNEEIKIDSMNEMRRKRCWGLSSCCDRHRTDSAQMMINQKSNEPQTKCQKCKGCMCAPFNLICRPFKRRKMDEADKKKNKNEKPSWWQRICCCSSCCKRCTKKGREERMKKKKMMPMQSTMDEVKPSCWSRLNCFKCCKPCCSRMCSCSRCCRKKDGDSTTSIESPKPNDTPSTCTRFFCFCCLCCRKPSTEEGEKRASMTSQQSSQEKTGNCCSRLCTTLFCCCCKKQSNRDSRRTSMLSKKQSLAPTIPPPEEKKPKLEMVLVEHASLMKGAIPVLPLCLAYFFLFCNVLIPGSGTILSGLICLCIGIPRFSQHDGARGRIGSFIINCIVGCSQAFTVIFCFVGWGWSIWWGTIMVHLAKRHRKLKKAEMLRQLDAERQLEEEAAAKEEPPRPAISRGKSRDVERGIN